MRCGAESCPWKSNTFYPLSHFSLTPAEIRNVPGETGWSYAYPNSTTATISKLVVVNRIVSPDQGGGCHVRTDLPDDRQEKRRRGDDRNHFAGGRPSSSPPGTASVAGDRAGVFGSGGSS